MKRQFGISIFLCIVFFQLNCGNSVKSNASKSNSEDVKIELTEDNLSQNLRLWKDKNISNYSFVLSRFGGGQYGWVPVVIQVENNKAISLKPARKKLELERIDGYEDFDTFDKLFARIGDSYKKKYHVEVVYKKELGYPEKIIVDDFKTNHSGFYLEVIDFKVEINK